MTEVRITKISESEIAVAADHYILYELHDYFSFYVDNYRFNPKFRAGRWDGKIRLFHLGKKTLPAGLYWHLKTFCEEREYKFVDIDEFADANFSMAEAIDFIKSLELPSWLEIRDYQVKSFVKGVRKKRLTLLSPTSSGKSFIIYLWCRYFNVKTLLIVPSISLINQMTSDFLEYGYEEEVHQIYSGKEKYSDETITISTWQSLMNMPTEYFDQYEMVIGDECHGAKADQFSKILSKLQNASVRFGTTGTLDDTKVNPIVIQGHFGPVYRSISTREMMDKGYSADLKIKALLLKYSEEERKLVSKMSYQEEIDWLCANEKRNRYIKNLTRSLKGNVMILFNYVSKHGKVIEDLLRTAITDRPIHYISGETDADLREEIRKLVDKSENSILLASIKTSGTGLSIKNINHLIFISPSKAKIRTLQNIGRSLRKSDIKNSATLYDLADDLSYKKKENYTLDHFEKRLEIYKNEEFVYKIYEIAL